ncbi:MAG TPA: FAD-dependent oxidoreductase [Acidimicrobiales bacterium]|jgi:succinate dehydrogenase/fumarate reductase flavoprotein subunit|nr:FAD-dependent oxidoreductase [Acidimicrobiales bacterium]
MSSGRPDAEVVVIGSGAAALSAALAAHDAGASVAVLERSDSIGGTTAVSGGGVWMPANHVTGADDSRQDALAYMTALSRDRASAEHLQRYVDEGPEILAGLERRTKLRFRAIAWPDYHPEMDGARPTGRMIEPDLFDTTVLGDWASRLRRAPVLGLPLTLQESTVDWTPSYTPERYDGAEIKRRVQAHQVACGQALIAGLLDGCLSRRIEPVLSTRAVELRTAGGAVTGVVVERDGRREEMAARAVVLASGGYEWNADLVSRYLPGPLTHPTSPPVNEGDALLMAMELGADLANMNEAWWYPAGAVPGDEYEGRQLSRFVAVERTAPHTIIVDRFGHRFVNEAANYNDMQKAFFAFDANEGRPRHLPCWVIFDHQYRSRYPVISARPGGTDPEWLRRSDSLVELAGLVGIDPAGLEDTVARWNRFVSGGRDLDYGRGDSFYDRFHGDAGAAHPNLGTIEQGPFYACPVYLGCVGTSGGPRIDRSGRIQHVRGRAIPGLYGAGNAIASPAGPAYFGGGTTIGMALVWGHIAGTTAATDLTGP